MSGGYSDQDFIRLGFKQFDQWLGKADRELERFRNAPWAECLDHAANLAWTISHIDDWFYHHCQLPASNIELGEFRRKLLVAFPDHALFLDICNALKHHDLSKPRRASFEVETAVHDIVEDPKVIESDGPAQPLRGSRQHSVLALMGPDNTVLAYQTVSFGEFVLRGGERTLFVDLAADALRFWRSNYEITTSGKLPSWL
jgi:hypothetical protein